MTVFYDHGVYMTVAWFGLLFVNIASVRWFSSYWNKTILIHAITGIAITAITITWTYKVTLEYGLNEPHGFVGSFYFWGIIPVSITGMIALIARQKLTWKTNYINFFRKAHKFLSSILVIASFLVIYSGFLIYY